MTYSLRNITIAAISVLIIVLLILFFTYDLLIAQEKEQAHIDRSRHAMQQLQPALLHAQELETVCSKFAEKRTPTLLRRFDALRLLMARDSVNFSHLADSIPEDSLEYVQLAGMIPIISQRGSHLIEMSIDSSLSKDSLLGLADENERNITSFIHSIQSLEDSNRQVLNASYASSLNFTRKTYRYIRLILFILISLLVLGFIVVYKDFRRGRMANVSLTQSNRELESKVKEQASQALSAKKLSDSIINSLPGVFFLQDASGRFLWWNRDFEKISGYGPEDIRNLTVLNFFDPGDHQSISDAQRVVFETGSAQIEAVALTRDQRKIPFYFSAQLIQHEGKPCVIGTGIDITDRKKIEKENENVRQQLNERIKELTTLYKISRVLENKDWSIPELLQEIVQVLPQGWQYEPITAARIVLDDQEFKTRNFDEGPHKQMVSFAIPDGPIGKIEVVYLTRIETDRPDVFLSEERDLLNMTAEMISSSLSRKIKSEALTKSEANFHTILTTTDTIYILLNNNFKVISYNDRARLFSKRELDIDLADTSADFMKKFSPDYTSVLTEWLLEANPGDQVSYERSYLQADGSLHWYAVKMFPITATGETVFGMMLAISDVTAQKRMEQEILDKEVRAQKNITREVLKAQENERNKIGQELHDNVNQILASAKLYLNMAYSDHPQNPHLIKQSMELLDEVISEIRKLSSQEVTPLKEIQLKGLIESLVDTLNYNSNISVELIYSLPSDQSIEEDLKLNIYRIIQEQINNILKHASANQITISVEKINNSISLTIADNGVGFDPGQKRRGIGISNMTNRVGSYNGEINIDSSPGNGCRVLINIPLEV